MEIDAVNSVPIVGQPVAYGVGLGMLFLLGLAPLTGRYALTLVHEGGHMLAAVASLRKIQGFTLADNTEGLTVIEGRRWALSTLVFFFAGYATPCLLGLGGAALIASGNTWSVLILGLIFSLLAIVPAANGLAFLMPTLAAVGIGWALIQATPTVQAGVAVGIVWYLLIGGTIYAFTLPTRDGDAADLRKRTVVVPGIVWKAAWIVIAVVCLWNGGRLLLVPGA
ncbi:peptidase M50B-like protein [Pseudonocardia sediminis]|uniref:Peptidase M50B-like protein n=1 Tax=Pseudonocardia sediminis TaxID=1397368 RepID=A0A4Q7UP86_PSEST|nr:M50 family metallopeptidase [Pseudonocardia sediminis]RZT83306.1 peptidase M50B-like protein [Pseudonocardia sediminis]